MSRKLFKSIAALAVTAATFGFFAYYFANHPSVRHRLAETPPMLIMLLLVLYGGTILALTLMTVATLRICKLKLKLSESFLLTAYTAVINFFGPLQSGPAFRAVYLRKKHGLNLKNYAMATLFYYVFFAGFSGLFLISGLLKWWTLPLVGLGGVALVLSSRLGVVSTRTANLDLGDWYYLALATFLQVSLVAFIYYVELKSVAPGVSLSQAIIYTGAANLALFVSITPGAIGFRESFLLFSQRLHHVSPDTIVAANILDRSIYILFLLVLAVIIFSTHASRRLKVATVASPEP